MYVVETLQRDSHRYSPQRVSQGDVEKVNRLITAIAAMRQGNPRPTDGDVIFCCTSTKNLISDRGYLEHRENRLIVCENPSSIHLDELPDGKIYTSAGGGPWTAYMDEQRFRQQAMYMSPTMTWFWTCDANAGGGIYFQAQVSFWRFYL